MINFPILNTIRSAAENNRSRKNGSAKASKDTAEVSAGKPVNTTERRRDPAHRGHSDRDGRRAKTPGSKRKESEHKARHIDISV